MFLSQSTKKWSSSGSKTQFTLWTVWDDSNSFQNFLKDFKEKNSNYKNLEVQVTSFKSYEEYYYALFGAFLRNEAPDMFVVNNSDAPIFEKNISGIDPSIISPDDFRNNYEQVFSNDLIKTTKVDDKEVEFLLWIPLGYESLGMFYNFREVGSQKLSTWWYINDFVRKQRSENDAITIGIGNGSTVPYVSDIITQFLLLEGIKELKNATGNKVKSALWNYQSFGDINWENRYNELFEDLLGNNKNAIDAYSKWDVQIVVWYPRLLEELDKKWVAKPFLRGGLFPMYSENAGSLMINYNFFAINKNTSNYGVAQDLMKYFASEDGQKNYLKNFAYYLPSRLSLKEARSEENLKSWYSLKYKDFMNDGLELTTFSRGMKNIYDESLSKILDSQTNASDLFDILRKKVLCMSQKSLSSEELEKSCDWF